METARGSNAAKGELLKEQHKEFPDKEFWLMVKDRVDRTKGTRNHWLSWALSGTVRNVTKGEYYEVYTAALNAAKADYTAITHRKASDNGVLMKPFDKGRRTKSIPAHFWDRAVEVPWSPDWKGSAFGEAKHPQGATQPKKPKPEKPVEEKPEGMERQPENPRAPEAPPIPVPAVPVAESLPIHSPATVRRQLAFKQLESDELITQSFGEVFGVDDDLKEIFDYMQRQDSRWIPKPKKGLWDFEEDLVTLQGKETGRLFDEKGAVQLERSGPVNVQFFYDELFNHRFHRMTHNHYNGTSFSHADLILGIVSNLREVRVIGTINGRATLYSFARKHDAVWDSKKLKKGAPDAKWKWSIEDLERVYDAYASAYNEKLIALDASTGFNRDQRAILATDYASSVVASQVNATYSRMPLK